MFNHCSINKVANNLCPYFLYLIISVTFSWACSWPSREVTHEEPAHTQSHNYVGKKGDRARLHTPCEAELFQDYWIDDFVSARKHASEA